MLEKSNVRFISQVTRYLRHREHALRTRERKGIKEETKDSALRCLRAEIISEVRASEASLVKAFRRHQLYNTAAEMATGPYGS